MATQFAKAYEDVGEASRQVQAYQNGQASAPEPKAPSIYSDGSNNELLQRILKSSPDDRKKWSKSTASRLRRRPVKNEACVLWSKASPAGTFSVKSEREVFREKAYGHLPAAVGGDPQGGCYTSDFGAVCSFGLAPSGDEDRGVSAAFSPEKNALRSNCPPDLQEQLLLELNNVRFADRVVHKDRLRIYNIYGNRPVMIAA